ncbi:MAG TPA: hypothetical protein VNX46_15880 [Candidatus Acidoferrum sp.]|jgi:hypothetical protein|nr:hypothetical protein [Candidatus Acidoferrum sp.]
MKRDLTTTVLNLVLAVLVFLSFGFTLLVIRREPEVPAATAAAVKDNQNLMRVNAVLNDVIAYNATARDPELTRLIEAARQQPAAH